MQIYRNPELSVWNDLCKRPSSENPVVRERVEAIIERVRFGGDTALRQISEEIDGRRLNSIRVSDKEINAAAKKVAPEVQKAIADAYNNIAAFHQAQMPKRIVVETAPGVKCIQQPVPIKKVGLYIPGGTAPLFSTVLMLAIPAKLSGCQKVELCTPARPDGSISPEVLYAASFCGIRRIFRIGGAQAIAAMAYGTETVDKVDKIFGPGNQYVTTAKQLVSGKAVSIDMPAGPSEVLVIADRTANPKFVAADLLSQAEHGADSQAVLVCNDESLAEDVFNEVERQKQLLSRSELVEASLSKSRIFVFSNEFEMIRFTNRYAPEHLIIQVENPWNICDSIINAGSVFIGPYSTESAGDYASGTNHTLPTCAWARSQSGVNIDSFMRKMTIQEITRDGLESLSGTIMTMAKAEGLDAHANAVKIRLDEDQ